MYVCQFVPQHVDPFEKSTLCTHHLGFQLHQGESTTDLEYCISQRDRNKRDI